MRHSMFVSGLFFCSVVLNRNAHTLLTTPADLHPAQRVERVGPNLLGRISLTSANGSVPEPAKNLPELHSLCGVMTGSSTWSVLYHSMQTQSATKAHRIVPTGPRMSRNYIWSHQLHNMNHFELLVNLQALKRIVCYKTYP